MAEGAAISWFHCFSGVTGEMALGSLVDAGADLDEVRALCDRLPLVGWEFEAHPVRRSGVAATRVHVACEETSVVRTGRHIAAMIDEARLPARVRRRAQAAFDLLVEADGRVHRRPADQLHFHELGDLSTILEVVGTCAALEVLGIDEVYASPIALGRGMVRGGLGMVPVPTPLTVELLRSAPTYGLDIAMELTTPAGAALLSSLVTDWGPMPSMVVQASGFGAGVAEIDGRPRVTQVVTGVASADLAPGQPVTLLEATLDDVTGETMGHAMAAVLDAGAHDVWVTPVIRGRGLPGHVMAALVDSPLAGQVSGVMANETGTHAIRAQRIEQWPASRNVEEVDVDGRRVRVEVSTGRVKVEHADATLAARHIGIPVREVVSLAEEAWRRRSHAELTEVIAIPTSDEDGEDDRPVGSDPNDDDIA